MRETYKTWGGAELKCVQVVYREEDEDQAFATESYLP